MEAARPRRTLGLLVLAPIFLVACFLWIYAAASIPQPPRVETRATPEEAAAIKRDIAIVILTSSPTFEKRLGDLLNSWATKWSENTYWLSDGDMAENTKFPASMKAQYIKTPCPATYQDGLLCKNRVMIEMFRKPEFQHYKWVMRLMDDTWIHMENLHWLASQYDHKVPLVLGEKYCHPKFTYPTGGPGFLISRGIIDRFDFTSWDFITTRNTKETVFDDLVWGQQLASMNAPLVHYNGFSQFGAGFRNPIFRYMLSRFTWDLPFRPVAYHQGPRFMHLMADLEDIMHRLPYNIVETKNPLPSPECLCFDRGPNFHEVRCAPKITLSESHRIGCGSGLNNINCITGR